MVGRPVGGAGGSSRTNDLLLDLDDSQHTYTSGRGPPTTDDNLLRTFDISDADEAGGRPSVSYDDFVGARVERKSSNARQEPRPAYLTSEDRLYSQTSDLGNYHGDYGDFDDYPDDNRDDYYAAGGIDEHTPQVMGRASAGNRFLAVGGGLIGRARRALGIRPQYSEMDLPLTEAGVQTSRAGPDGVHGGHPDENKPSGSGFKFPSFGRGKVDYAALGPRMIELNNSPANASMRFSNNSVSTAKYNAITFLPKFIFEQFTKYSNLFFLFTAILQQIPNVSPTSRWTTIVPLTIVLIVSAIKEGVEDWRRRQSDTSLNNADARVLRGSEFLTVRWANVMVGDILRVESEESFPADLVLLASSEPEGLCFIETANLDGETNLKLKQALPETAHLVVPNELSRISGRIKSEQPNSSLYTYEATLTMKAGGSEKEVSLQPDQLLLRGATLRNTPWLHGIVVFTGHESKLMRNATATPIKRTAVDRMLNKQILALGGILLVLSLISSICHLIVELTSGDTLQYLYIGDFSKAGQFFRDILTYWVLYSNLLPISLFVTIDIVKYCHAVLINSDLDMYYDKTDTPANCRTSSLVEELGQVEYVFSDKTGTLTCNQMDFRQCSIAGVQYADEVPEDRKAINGDPNGIYSFTQLADDLRTSEHREIMDQFLTLLSTCHTVIPERKDEKLSSIKYQAASPDEGALVEGGVMLGYQFIARKPKAVIIHVAGRELKYELLATCEFNSTRKRMSIVVRCPDGKIRLYCKGADTVIMERLTKDKNPYVERTLLHLEEYAVDGLRTLCLAMREVPEYELQEWLQVYRKAQNTVGGNRPEELDKAAEILEHDLTLLGATAIEDKLQDGVPETIHTLQTAGIKVWVLTGDRQETAINIGMSCKLISEDMSLLTVNEESRQATRENLQRKMDAIKSHIDSSVEMESLALVIDGASLIYALEAEMEHLFLDLAIRCKAVICCRVSPLQKALVVKLVKRNLKSILLAIGDGANDVSMIQAAHVGVGIAGVEGLQAARSADVAIGQFRYLRKLLLVHGSWSYHRISNVILYSFYKNIAFFMTQFWYSWSNDFSGEVIAESWTLSFYNVFFTVWPPFVIGICEQFVSARLLDRYPQLYQLAQKGTFFNMQTFFSWVLNGFYHSLIIYFTSLLIFYGDLRLGSGQMAGHWLWGTTVYSAALVTVLLKAALVSNTWTKYHVLAIPGSFLVWLAYLPIYSTVAPLTGVSLEYQGLLTHIFTSPVFWLTNLVVPFLCLSRDYAWKYAKRMYYPVSYHHIQEIQKYNIQDYRPRMEQFQKAIRKVRQVQRMRKQRGYAFSQTDESQARVLNAYDTTKERGRYGELKATQEAPLLGG